MHFATLSNINRWSWSWWSDRYNKNINNKVALQFDMKERLYAIHLYLIPGNLRIVLMMKYNINCYLIFFFRLWQWRNYWRKSNLEVTYCTVFKSGYFILNKLNYKQFIIIYSLWIIRRIYFGTKGLKHKLLDNEIKF